MKVEFVPHVLKSVVYYHGARYESESPSGFDYVMVDGRHAGWVPSDPDDPFHDCFHPLSGFPQSLCNDVVKNSGGRLKRSLRAPVPHASDEEEE